MGTGVGPDANLAMDKCDLQDESYDKDWKQNNNGLWASMTPSWLTGDQAATTTAAPSPMCNYAKTSGGKSTISEGQGVIKSENYPRSYPNDQICKWKLVNSDDSKYIEVTVNKVDMHCNDRLKVAPKGSRSFSLCRVRRPLVLTDPTAIDITFTSDPIQTKAGFTLSFRFK